MLCRGGVSARKRRSTPVLTSWRGRQKNWGDSRTGKRKGAPVGFARFKSKHRSRGSVRFTTGATGCETRHAVLPRLGRIKAMRTRPG